MGKKIFEYILGFLTIVILFLPLYIGIIYEPWRSYHYWYEILLYIATLTFLFFLSGKIYKNDK